MKLIMMWFIRSKFCKHKKTTSLLGKEMQIMPDSQFQYTSKATFTPDSRPTPDQFLWLGRVWSGKKLPALIEERIYPRSTPDVSLMHPRSNPALPDNPHPRSSDWPIPALHYEPPTYCWYNYDHYAQYREKGRDLTQSYDKSPYTNRNVKRTNLRSVCLISTTGLKWIIQANVMPTDSLMRVQYPKWLIL